MSAGSGDDGRAGRRVRPWTFGEIARDQGVDRSTVHGWAVRGELPYRWNKKHTRREVSDAEYRKWREQRGKPEKPQG